MAAGQSVKLSSAEELLSLITGTAGLYHRDRIAMVNTFRNKVLEAAAEEFRMLQRKHQLTIMVDAALELIVKLKEEL